MDTSHFWFALGLTVFAGLSTGIGSLIGLTSRKFNPRYLAGSLGFSAGVMIYVSFVEIFPKARLALGESYGRATAFWITTAAFFAGMVLIAIIDKLIPSFENPHELKLSHHINEATAREKKKLQRMGIFSALAIAIHNFPEGLATFMAGLADPALGVSIAVAIALHNIPEGLAVSVPVYYATKSRKRAFVLSFLSGLSEPLGALIGYFLLKELFNNSFFGVIFAGVAGIMVYISLDELLPTAEEYGEHHVAIFSLMGGMAVMAASLLLFA